MNEALTRPAIENNEHGIAHKKLAAGLRKVIKMIPSRPETLDVGIGNGALSREILALSPAARITGIDQSSRMLSLCEKSGIAKNLKRADISCERLSFKDATFDLAVAASAMEHTENIGNALQEMVRVTRGGGLVAFTYLPATAQPMRHFLGGQFKCGGTDEQPYPAFYAHNARKVHFYARVLGLEPLLMADFNQAPATNAQALAYKLFIGRKAR